MDKLTTVLADLLNRCTPEQAVHVNLSLALLGVVVILGYLAYKLL